MNEEAKGERLHKVLARAGIGSRRVCERFILEGRVTVDRQVVTTLGMLVDPLRQQVRFDGEVVRLETPAYYLVYKPPGVVCTTRDQFGRSTVVDLIPDRRRRLFPVGRLEEDSEGLILVTNDGEFADRLARPRHPLAQTYFLKVRGRLTPEALTLVREGVWLSDGKTGPMAVKVLRAGKKVSTLLVSPASRQHRQIRRAFAKVGLQVERAVRTRIGSLTTAGLKKATWRRLSSEEVGALLNPPPGGERSRLRGRSRRPRASAPSPHGKGSEPGPPGGRRRARPAPPSKRARGPRRVIGP